MPNKLYEELKIYVFVRDYLRQYNAMCIDGINDCIECGLCWMNPKEITEVGKMLIKY